MSLPLRFGWNSLLNLRLSIEVKRSEPTEFTDSVSPIFAGNSRMTENERRTMFNDSYFFNFQSVGTLLNEDKYLLNELSFVVLLYIIQQIDNI